MPAGAGHPRLGDRGAGRPVRRRDDTARPRPEAHRRGVRRRGAGEHDVVVQVLDIIDSVANDTGAAATPVDPLQDDIFRTLDTLAEELDVDEEDVDALDVRASEGDR